MFKTLMTTRRFAPLFWCQFLSALNDNFVKNALVILILFKIGSDARARALVALAGAVLVAPFFILSGIGGELADRYDKAEMAARLKRAEIPIALVAALGFVLHSVPLLFVALGCYGVIAALFGPIKYGILPALLDAARDSGRQRLHRKRDLRRDPDRHHRRRHRRLRERRVVDHRRTRRRAGDAVLVHGHADPEDRRRRAGSRHRHEPLDVDRDAAQAICAATAGCGSAA